MERRLRKALWAALPILGATLCTNVVGAGSPDLQRALSDGAARPSPAPGTSRAGQHAGGDIRASRIIGMEVEDRSGRRVGRIEDLIVDMRRARVAYALLDAGESAAAGGQRLALPVDRVSAALEGDRIVLRMDPAQLRTYPAFRQGDEPDWDEVHERLGDGGQSAGPVDRLRRFRGASRLLEADLRDGAGKDVGDVDDFVVSLPGGEIRYGVAEFDPSLVERGKLVVIPVTKVESEVGGDDLVIGVDRAELREAPAFDRDRWPDVNEPGFRARMAEFIGKMEGYADRLSARSGG